jgi:hypothetical protein
MFLDVTSAGAPEAAVRAVPMHRPGREGSKNAN